jgi:hypothetical protein
VNIHLADPDAFIADFIETRRQSAASLRPGPSSLPVRIIGRAATLLEQAAGSLARWAESPDPQPVALGQRRARAGR